MRWECVAALTAVMALPGAAQTWTRAPGLIDVRHAGARDITEAIGHVGAATLPLPFPLLHDGRLLRDVTVGPGWIRLEETGHGDSPPGRGLVVDVLSGPAIEIGADSRVLASLHPDGVAIRFVALHAPGGPATVEALVLPSGDVRTQFLRVPAALRSRASDDVRSGLAGDEIPVAAATAWSARLAAPAPIPVDTARPAAGDPAPAGCAPDATTWCERADGPGSSAIWLSESFDDGATLARGWSASGEWRESTFGTCGGGATSDPGRAWYYGSERQCSYASRSTGILSSPQFGPITSGARLSFLSRVGVETGAGGVPIDRADVLVNGTLAGRLPGTLDPLAWYSFSLDLAPWAGRVVTLGFRFTSDVSIESLGWFLDDVVVHDPGVGRPDCVIGAGHEGMTACDVREASAWRFDEQDYCRGCEYTFYVLVECGREMHLPLQDMEGADIRVTNMLDPLAPVTLRCVNETARAAAGTGPEPARPVIDPRTGSGLDCCDGDGLPEGWWGPPLDATDSAGPGRVAWGLADACPPTSVYDLDGNGLTCDELPPTCGGLLERASPGEEQLVDCFLHDESGLCGLYRVDVISGGHAWTLFANCDGTSAPQFPIFFDCTDAWAAFHPLPELALTDIVVTGTCPDVNVDLDVVNIGCAPTPGDVVVRIRVGAEDPTTCGEPESTRDVVVPGPIGAGERVHVTERVTASCVPSRVRVAVDPDDTVTECSESPSATACRAEQGLDALVATTCSCAASLAADAGPDVMTCPTTAFMLDGSASRITGCVTPEYRWLDPAGLQAAGWSSDPTLLVPLADCARAGAWRLEIRCAGEPCTAADEALVSCVATLPPSPTAEATCGIARLDCGALPPSASVEWDLDLDEDADGSGAADDDVDATTCVVSRAYAPGSHRARVSVVSAAGCRETATIELTMAAPTMPDEVRGDRAVRLSGGLRLSWPSVPGAASYRVSQGRIGSWYSHAVLDSSGCDTVGALEHVLSDAVTGPGAYFIVTALEPCGLEGPAGDGFDGRGARPRPERRHSAECP